MDEAPEKVETKDVIGQVESKEIPETKKIEPEKKIETPKMVHLVFFDIKEDLSVKQLEFLEVEIKKLGKIETIKEFHFGEYEDVGDERTLTEREMVISMKFNNMDDFYSYQKDERHFAVKKVIQPFLEKLPMTYDYMIQ